MLPYRASSEVIWDDPYGEGDGIFSPHVWFAGSLHTPFLTRVSLIWTAHQSIEQTCQYTVTYKFPGHHLCPVCGFVAYEQLDLSTVGDSWEDEMRYYDMPWDLIGLTEGEYEEISGAAPWYMGTDFGVLGWVHIIGATTDLLEVHLFRPW